MNTPAKVLKQLGEFGQPALSGVSPDLMSLWLGPCRFPGFRRVAALLPSTGDLPAADRYTHHTRQEQGCGDLPDQFRSEWTENKQSFDLISKPLFFYEDCKEETPYEGHIG